MSRELLSTRALNRATLERQLLLRRAKLGAVDAVAHLVGLQAQEPFDPYTALWSRLERFDPMALSEALVERRVVRTVVMRGTVHLVTADDALTLRPLVQPVLDAELRRHRDVARAIDGVDLAPVLAHARELFAERPRSGRELRAALAERFPQHDAAALAYACRNLLPLVQVPPRGLWGQRAQVRSTTTEAWLGRPLAKAPALADIVLRYLRAFGPAAVADVTAWSRLTGLREIVDALRPRLRTFRDERGRELFDLPDAPRPDPGMPAPVRFLPTYDNVLLSFAERSRFVRDRGPLTARMNRNVGTVLHDGLVRGVWWIERSRGRATLVVKPVERLSKRAAASVAAEGRRYVRFATAEAEDVDVRLLPAE